LAQEISSKKWAGLIAVPDPLRSINGKAPWRPAVVQRIDWIRSASRSKH
jgi:hypothetical protein